MYIFQGRQQSPTACIWVTSQHSKCFIFPVIQVACGWLSFPGKRTTGVNMYSHTLGMIECSPSHQVSLQTNFSLLNHKCELISFTTKNVHLIQFEMRRVLVNQESYSRFSDFEGKKPRG